jgi:hypothetical protein
VALLKICRLSGHDLMFVKVIVIGAINAEQEFPLTI